MKAAAGGMSEIEICLLIGNLADLETRMTTDVRGMIQLRDFGKRMGAMHEWQLYGFQSQKAFEAVMHRTDLVIVDGREMGDPVSCERLSQLLELIGAVGVIIGLVDCASQTLEAVSHEPAILWLEGQVVVLTCMPGGVAVSYRMGCGGAVAGRRVAEVLRSAGGGEIAVGIGMYGGSGHVVVPRVAEALVLVAERGVVLNYSAFRDTYYLIGASLARSGLERIPDWCFDGCTGLTLVSLPPQLTTVGSYSFYGCLGLAHVEMPGVVAIEPAAFRTCPALRGVVIDCRLKEVGSSCFEGTGLIEFVSCSVSVKVCIRERSFYASALEQWAACAVDVGHLALAGCRRLRSLGAGPGAKFDGTCLEGSGPVELCYDGVLSEARAVFEDVLSGLKGEVFLRARTGAHVQKPGIEVGGVHTLSIFAEAPVLPIDVRMIILSEIDDLPDRGWLGVGIWPR
jgi:hypothetical protein